MIAIAAKLSKNSLAVTGAAIVTALFVVAVLAPVLAPYDVAEIDADIIRRVLANLIGNAIKFTSPDGVVRVVACTVDSVARVEVSDNGPGIAPELHATIFEKFGQVRDDRAHLGTGLGLTFCKMAVEAHGGAIGVTSTPGAGSTFWFTLPLTP